MATKNKGGPTTDQGVVNTSGIPPWFALGSATFGESYEGVSAHFAPTAVLADRQQGPLTHDLYARWDPAAWVVTGWSSADGEVRYEQSFQQQSQGGNFFLMSEAQARAATYPEQEVPARRVSPGRGRPASTSRPRVSRPAVAPHAPTARRQALAQRPGRSLPLLPAGGSTLPLLPAMLGLDHTQSDVSSPVWSAEDADRQASPPPWIEVATSPVATPQVPVVQLSAQARGFAPADPLRQVLVSPGSAVPPTSSGGEVSTARQRRLESQQSMSQVATPAGAGMAPSAGGSRAIGGRTPDQVGRTTPVMPPAFSATAETTPRRVVGAEQPSARGVVGSGAVSPRPLADLPRAGGQGLLMSEAQAGISSSSGTPSAGVARARPGQLSQLGVKPASMLRALTASVEHTRHSPEQRVMSGSTLRAGVASPAQQLRALELAQSPSSPTAPVVSLPLSREGSLPAGGMASALRGGTPPSALQASAEMGAVFPSNATLAGVGTDLTSTPAPGVSPRASTPAVPSSAPPSAISGPSSALPPAVAAAASAGSPVYPDAAQVVTGEARTPQVRAGVTSDAKTPLVATSGALVPAQPLPAAAAGSSSAVTSISGSAGVPASAAGSGLAVTPTSGQAGVPASAAGSSPTSFATAPHSLVSPSSGVPTPPESTFLSVDNQAPAAGVSHGLGPDAPAVVTLGPGGIPVAAAGAVLSPTEFASLAATGGVPGQAAVVRPLSVEAGPGLVDTSTLVVPGTFTPPEITPSVQKRPALGAMAAPAQPAQAEKTAAGGERRPGLVSTGRRYADLRMAPWAVEGSTLPLGGERDIRRTVSGAESAAVLPEGGGVLANLQVAQPLKQPQPGGHLDSPLTLPLSEDATRTRHNQGERRVTPVTRPARVAATTAGVKPGVTRQGGVSSAAPVGADTPSRLSAPSSAQATSPLKASPAVLAPPTSPALGGGSVVAGGISRGLGSDPTSTGPAAAELAASPGSSTSVREVAATAVGSPSAPAEVIAVPPASGPVSAVSTPRAAKSSPAPRLSASSVTPSSPVSGVSSTMEGGAAPTQTAAERIAAPGSALEGAAPTQTAAARIAALMARASTPTGGQPEAAALLVSPQPESGHPGVIPGGRSGVEIESSAVLDLGGEDNILAAGVPTSNLVEAGQLGERGPVSPSFQPTLDVSGPGALVFPATAEGQQPEGSRASPRSGSPRADRAASAQLASPGRTTPLPTRPWEVGSQPLVAHSALPRMETRPGAYQRRDRQVQPPSGVSILAAPYTSSWDWSNEAAGEVSDLSAPRRIPAGDVLASRGVSANPVSSSTSLDFQWRDLLGARLDWLGSEEGVAAVSARQEMGGTSGVERSRPVLSSTPGGMSSPGESPTVRGIAAVSTSGLHPDAPAARAALVQAAPKSEEGNRPSRGDAKVRRSASSVPTRRAVSSAARLKAPLQSSLLAEDGAQGRITPQSAGSASVLSPKTREVLRQIWDQQRGGQPVRPQLTSPDRPTWQPGGAPGESFTLVRESSPLEGSITPKSGPGAKFASRGEAQGQSTPRAGSLAAGEGPAATRPGSLVAGEGQFSPRAGSLVAGDGPAATRAGSFTAGESQSGPRAGSLAAGESQSGPRAGSLAAGESQSAPRAGSFTAGESQSAARAGSLAAGEGQSAPRPGSLAAGEGQSAPRAGSFAAGEGSEATRVGSLAAGDGQSTAPFTPQGSEGEGLTPVRPLSVPQQNLIPPGAGALLWEMPISAGEGDTSPGRHTPTASAPLSTPGQSPSLGGETASSAPGGLTSPRLERAPIWREFERGQLRSPTVSTLVAPPWEGDGLSGGSSFQWQDMLGPQLSGWVDPAEMGPGGPAHSSAGVMIPRPALVPPGTAELLQSAPPLERESQQMPGRTGRRSRQLGQAGAVVRDVRRSVSDQAPITSSPAGIGGQGQRPSARGPVGQAVAGPTAMGGGLPPGNIPRARVPSPAGESSSGMAQARNLSRPGDISPTGGAPVAMSPAGSTPLGMSPAGSTPLGMSPAGSTPLGMSPAGSTPLGMSPAGSTPVGMSPRGQSISDVASGDPLSRRWDAAGRGFVPGDGLAPIFPDGTGQGGVTSEVFWESGSLPERARVQPLAMASDWGHLPFPLTVLRSADLTGQEDPITQSGGRRSSQRGDQRRTPPPKVRPSAGGVSARSSTSRPSALPGASVSPSGRTQAQVGASAGLTVGSQAQSGASTTLTGGSQAQSGASTTLTGGSQTSAGVGVNPTRAAQVLPASSTVSPSAVGVIPSLAGLTLGMDPGRGLTAGGAVLPAGVVSPGGGLMGADLGGESHTLAGDLFPTRMADTRLTHPTLVVPEEWAQGEETFGPGGTSPTMAGVNHRPWVPGYAPHERLTLAVDRVQPGEIGQASSQVAAQGVTPGQSPLVVPAPGTIAPSAGSLSPRKPRTGLPTRAVVVDSRAPAQGSSGDVSSQVMARWQQVSTRLSQLADGPGASPALQRLRDVAAEALTSPTLPASVLDQVTYQLVAAQALLGGGEASAGGGLAQVGTSSGAGVPLRMDNSSYTSSRGSSNFSTSTPAARPRLDFLFDGGGVPGTPRPSPTATRRSDAAPSPSSRPGQTADSLERFASSLILRPDPLAARGVGAATRVSTPQPQGLREVAEETPLALEQTPSRLLTEELPVLQGDTGGLEVEEESNGVSPRRARLSSQSAWASARRGSGAYSSLPKRQSVVKAESLAAPSSARGIDRASLLQSNFSAPLQQALVQAEGRTLPSQPLFAQDVEEVEKVAANEDHDPKQGTPQGDVKSQKDGLEEVIEEVRWRLQLESRWLNELE